MAALVTRVAVVVGRLPLKLRHLIKGTSLLVLDRTAVFLNHHLHLHVVILIRADPSGTGERGAQSLLELVKLRIRAGTG